MKQLLKDWGPTLGPIATLLIIVVTKMPITMVLIVLGYIILVIVYISLSWRHLIWTAMDDQREKLRRLLRRTHIIWRVLVFSIPLITVLSYKSIELFPRWTEALIYDTVEDRHNIEKIESSLTKVSPGNIGLQAGSAYVTLNYNSNLYIAPAPKVLNVAVLPFLSYPTNTALWVFLLLIALLIGMIMAQQFSEAIWAMSHPQEKGQAAHP